MQVQLGPLLQDAYEKRYRLIQHSWARREDGRAGISSEWLSSGKPTELLNEREFHEHFFIPNGVSIQLVDEDPTSNEKAT